MAKLRIANARTAEQWAEIILSKWQDSVAGIMEAGLLLHNAKEELAAAEFWQMANERLRFSQKTIYKLIKIGTDPKLMEVAHARLPAGWYTLWLLAGLTDEQFQHGLDAGIIHAGMERADVKLLKPSKDKPAAEVLPTGQELIERRTIETRQQLVRVLRELNAAEQAAFLGLIRMQLDDLETRIKKAA